MSQQCYHLDQANHNQELAEFINNEKTKYIDWVFSIAFYAAIHFVEAHMATKNNLIGTEEKMDELRRQKGLNELSPHKAREMIINDYYPLKKIKREFMKLRYRSEQARYLKGIEKTAYDFFNIADSNESLKDLNTIKNTLT